MCGGRTLFRAEVDSQFGMQQVGEALVECQAPSPMNVTALWLTDAAGTILTAVTLATATARSWPVQLSWSSVPFEPTEVVAYALYGDCTRRKAASSLRTWAGLLLDIDDSSPSPAVHNSSLPSVSVDFPNRLFNFSVALGAVGTGHLYGSTLNPHRTPLMRISYWHTWHTLQEGSRPNMTVNAPGAATTYATAGTFRSPHIPFARDAWELSVCIVMRGASGCTRTDLRPAYVREIEASYTVVDRPAATVTGLTVQRPIDDGPETGAGGASAWPSSNSVLDVKLRATCHVPLAVKTGNEAGNEIGRAHV